jgi:hypothetical protein
MAAVALGVLIATGGHAEEAGPPPDRSAACALRARGIAKWEASIARQLLPGGYPEAVPRLLAYRDRYVRRYADSCIALNQIQSLGTHNSYHVIPRPALLSSLIRLDPQFLGWEYTRQPLPDQFEFEGIRQIELDVFADPAGGLFGFRPVLGLLGDDPIAPDPAMFEPGLKVLHVQDLDFETTCSTLVQCLLQIRDWSDAHPRHLPIAVLVELKDEVIPDPFQLGFATPIPFGPAELDLLDAEILSVFPPEQLLTPDEVRVPGLTLEASVLDVGWPTLGEVRGRVMFMMDNGGGLRIDYLAGRPNLEGRVLFTNGVPGEPDAAFVKRNDPVLDFGEIQDLVDRGYLVRTRADADTNEARTGDTTRRDAALASGAHFVSTDYPTPDTLFGTGYQVTIPGGSPSACNPLSAPAGCRPSGLEPDGGLPAQ